MITKKTLHIVSVILLPLLFSVLFNYFFHCLTIMETNFELLSTMIVLRALIFAAIGFSMMLIYKITQCQKPKAVLFECAVFVLLAISIAFYEFFGSTFWPKQFPWYLFGGMFFSYEQILPLFTGSYLFLMICSLMKLRKKDKVYTDKIESSNIILSNRNKHNEKGCPLKAVAP